MEVEGEERGAECRPEQAEEQKGALVTPSLVFVEEEQPQLQVHRHKEGRIKSRVQDREAKLDRREDGGKQGHRQGRGGGVGIGGGCEWRVHRKVRQDYRAVILSRCNMAGLRGRPEGQTDSGRQQLAMS